MHLSELGEVGGGCFLGRRGAITIKVYTLSHEWTLAQIARSEAVTAKLFRNGRSQAVRLPEEFRFEGDAVSVRRVDHGVLLEPIRPWPTVDELRARFALMDSLGADDLFPEGRDQGVLAPEDLLG